MATLILIFLCLVLSAFFSCSEMAFVSCNKLVLRQRVLEGSREALIVDQFHRDPKKFLAFILVGNNLVNVSTVALTTYLLKAWFGLESELLVTLIVAPLLILFGETIPKDYGRQMANHAIYEMAPLLRFVYTCLKPLTSAILVAGDAFFRLLGSYEKKSPFVTKEEFSYLIEESVKQGVLQEHEKRLVDVIMNFRRIRVEQMMNHLAQVPHIEIASKVGDLKHLARETGGSFILVYEELPQIIVGVIYVFDVLFETDDTKPLTAFLRPPLFLSHSVSAEKGFLRLQEKRQSFAVVVDEEREAVGTVTIDNLLAF
jgi:CBS domain containing-hemolysin-like protein